MLFAGAIVVVVWTVLLGTAYLARGVLGLRRSSSLALLAGCYLALAGLALAAIGWSGRGLLGAAGMLVPLAMASALVLLTARST